MVETPVILGGYNQITLDEKFAKLDKISSNGEGSLRGENTILLLKIAPLALSQNASIPLASHLVGERHYPFGYLKKHQQQRNISQ